MRKRRTIGLLAALALLSPLVATAMPGCEPGAMMPHCPMMAALAAETPPCHGTAIEADDCCPDMTAAESATAPPAVGTAAVEAVPATPAADAVPRAETLVEARCDGASAPLYRLFRVLLI